MAQIETWYNQDLKQPVKVHYIHGNVFSQDNMGNVVGVNVFDNGVPASLSGTVSGSIIRSDGVTIAISGYLSGNRAYVAIPQAGYAIPGVISIIVKLTTSGVVTTLCAVVANVYQSQTGTVVDSGTIIPDISELIAEIESAVASIPADYSELWESLAKPFDTGETYKVGAYCLYNGGLYRFNVNHPSGSWVNGEAVKVDILTEAQRLVSDVKASVENPYTLDGLELEQGTANSSTGVKVPSTSRIRFSSMKIVHKGDCIEFTPGANIERYVATIFDADGTALRIYSSWLTQSVLPLEFSADTGYLMCVFSKSNDANIEPEDYDATFKIVHYDVYSHNVELEKGALDSSSNNRFSLNFARHGTNMRNKYPLILNGSKILIVPQMASASVLFFADSSDAYISSVNLNTTKETIIPVPSGAVYADMDIGNQSSDAITVEAFGGGEIYSRKRSYRYAGNTLVVDFDIQNETTFSCMSFDLPQNYSADGAKVPVFLWFAGTGGYPEIGSVFQGGLTRTGLEYIRDEGYAVIQIFPIGYEYYTDYPNAGKDQPYPIPICENCIESGLKYFADRYNVDIENVNVLGLSFGGIMGYHYAIRPLQGMKSVTLFDPCIDTLSMRGRFSDSRKLLAEELRFVGDHVTDFYDINEDGSTETGVENYYFSERCQAVWQDNMSALIRINPALDKLIAGTYLENYASSIADARAWWRNGKHSVTEIYDDDNAKQISGIPLKIIGAEDDDSTPHQIMEEKINQLRNAGNPAEIYLVPYGGHTSTNILPDSPWIQDVTTALGISYTDLPIGWIMAVEWARLNA